MPAVLVRSTIEAVVQPATTKTVPAAVSALTAAVCRAMFLTKLTISLVALLVVGTASLMAVQTLTFTRETETDRLCDSNDLGANQGGAGRCDRQFAAESPGVAADCGNSCQAP